MEIKDPGSHPNGYTSRQLAFADARMVVANLCAQARSPAYKAAVMDALRALDVVAPPDLESAASSPSGNDAIWALAVEEVGTVRVPPYTYPVIVLARPSEVGDMFRAIAKKVGAGTAASTGLDAHDRERLLYIGRVLRAISDLGRDTPLCSLWSEAVIATRTVRRILGISEADSSVMGLLPSGQALPRERNALGELMAGWQDAAVAWGSCASIHRAFARGKDPSFAARQQEYSQRADEANKKCSALAGPALAEAVG